MAGGLSGCPVLMGRHLWPTASQRRPRAPVTLPRRPPRETTSARWAGARGTTAGRLPRREGGRQQCRRRRRRRGPATLQCPSDVAMRQQDRAAGSEGSAGFGGDRTVARLAEARRLTAGRRAGARGSTTTTSSPSPRPGDSAASQRHWCEATGPRDRLGRVSWSRRGPTAGRRAGARGTTGGRLLRRVGGRQQRRRRRQGPATLWRPSDVATRRQDRVIGAGGSTGRGGDRTAAAGRGDEEEASDGRGEGTREAVGSW